jgi:Protein of unknown function (DUF2911)
MKRFLTIVCALGFGTVLAVPAFAQGNPRGTASLTIGNAKVTIEYGRPSVKGPAVSQAGGVQNLLDKLPAGEVWRLGADKSTTFNTTSDLDFSGTMVPKGEYSLWAQKQSDNSWKLVFNSQHGQWGTDHDASKDVVSVPLKQEKESTPAEQVTISLEKEHNAGELSIAWGDLELTTAFTPK